MSEEEGIICPECGCIIHLKWKTKEEIIKETKEKKK